MTRTRTSSLPRLSPWLAAIALLASFAASHGASAVTLGQVDDFEDGTTQFWLISAFGASPPAEARPTNVSTGGPAGADDNYLRLTSLGTSSAGGRLVALNANRWRGNFITANVVGISANVINLGATDVSLRLYFGDASGSSPTNEAVSTQAILLASGSGWTNVVFPTTVDALTALSGSASEALADVRQFRIFHALTAAFPGEPSVAQIGIDDITAVPEPGTGVLLGLGLVALAVRRLRP